MGVIVNIYRYCHIYACLPSCCLSFHTNFICISFPSHAQAIQFVIIQLIFGEACKYVFHLLGYDTVYIV